MSGLDAETTRGLIDPDITLPSFGSEGATTLSGLVSAERPARPRNSDDTGPLQVGQSFSARYHIIRVLGIGGMGAVYHAWDADLGVAVALKVIRPEATRDPATARELERRFKQELVLARQVTHKNVVRIHDMGEISGIKYITMPYLEGEDLASRLKQAGKLDVPSALPIIRDVAAGLTAAHEAGIIHRDLKPANIMVLKDRAIIMDFGIARAAGGPFTEAAVVGAPMPVPGRATETGATVVGTILGTVQYMAPEQAKGQPVDQRADIYALGLIFRDILVGKRRKALAEESALDELKRRIDTPPVPARTVDPTIPEAVDQFITRCVQPDPAARYQTSAEVVAALDRLDEQGHLIPVKRVVRLPLVAAVVVVLLALTVGTWWYQRQFIKDEPNEPVSVMIADFQNRTGDPAFDNTLAQTARRGLELAGFITAIDRSRFQSMVGVPPPDTLDENAARKIAANQGLEVVLAGSIAPTGRGYDIAVKAVRTISGEVVADISSVARGKDQVLATAFGLMDRVRRELGDDMSESEQQLAMRKVSTSSLDVVGHYAAAVEAQARGRFEEARQSYQKAVDLDPEFGLGYQGLAAMARNLGRMDESDRYIKEALRFVDKMTERERLATRGFFYRMSGDNQQCAAEYGQLLAQYKADAVAHNQRAICLAKLRKMPDAMNEMGEAVKLLPNHAGFRMNLALMTNLAGKFEAAEREVKAIPEPDARALLALAYSQIGRGMTAEATATYERIKTMGAAGASSAASGLGDLAMFQGRYSEAVRIFEEGAAADLAAKNPDRAAIKLTSAGFAQLAAGRKAAAIAAADRALQNGKSMPVRFLAGRVFAEAGALDKAKALAAPLSSDLAAEPHAHGRILEGQIALASGNAREAIRILGEANGILDTWFGHFDLGRAYLAAGGLTGLTNADTEFDLTIRRRGEALSLMDEGPTYGHFPIVYYHLGRVREAAKAANFADSYREYLKIRGDSQEDPLVPEVRRRIK